MHKVPLNEHFFDEESKAMWYVLGVSFSRYSPSRTDSRNSWCSSSYDLLKIVQSCLETEQTISDPTERGSRHFQVRSQYLQDVLIERGLVPDRVERKFPEGIKCEYIDHFIRGFFDAHVSCSTTTKSNDSAQPEHITRKLQVYFNVPFLIGLYHALILNAKVKSGREVTQSPLNFYGNDVMAIHDFMYQDWEFIQQNRLYVPSEKAKFRF